MLAHWRWLPVACEELVQQILNYKMYIKQKKQLSKIVKGAPGGEGPWKAEREN